MILCELAGLYRTDKSDIAGQGIFATKPIDADVSIGVAFKRIGNTGNLDADISRTKLGKMTNHAATPNMKVVHKGDVYTFVTIRRVQANEELTVDYNDFDFEGIRDFA